MTYGSNLFAMYYAQNSSQPTPPAPAYRTPPRYIEVDSVYIKAEAAISSGVDISSDQEWILTCARKYTESGAGDAGNKGMIGGGYSKTDSNMCLWLNNQTNLVEFTYGDGGNANYKVTTTAYDVCQFHTYRMKLSTGESWLDDDYIGAPASVSSVPHPKPCYIAGVWRGTSVTSYGFMFIKEFVIKQAGEVIRHFVAAFDTETGYYGLYDLCGSISADTGSSFYYKTAWTYAADIDATWTIATANNYSSYQFHVGTTLEGSTIDWGDGTVSAIGRNYTGQLSHNYVSQGTYSPHLTGKSLLELKMNATDTGNENITLTSLDRFKGVMVPRRMLINAPSLSMDSTVWDGTQMVMDEAFRECTGLVRPVLPPELRFIGSYVFHGDTALALTSLPDVVYHISSWAFTGGDVSLALTRLPSALAYVGPHAFHGCTNIALSAFPNSLTFIDSYAFQNCTNITATQLPVRLTWIGNSAFQGCTNLALTSLPAGITEIRPYAFNSCTNLALSELPSGVTIIDSYAFYGCANITLSELPDGVTTIGQRAFVGCSNITISEFPLGLATVGQEAFRGCSKLAISELPSGWTELPYSIFAWCSSITVSEIPDGITSMGNVAFTNCTSITSMTISASLVTFGTECFRHCENLAVVRFKGTPTTLPGNSLSQCNKLLDIYVPWSEGEVANAPWGATNATIHYNQTT